MSYRPEAMAHRGEVRLGATAILCWLAIAGAALGQSPLVAVADRFAALDVNRDVVLGRELIKQFESENREFWLNPEIPSEGVVRSALAWKDTEIREAGALLFMVGIAGQAQVFDPFADDEDPQGRERRVELREILKALREDVAVYLGDPSREVRERVLFGLASFPDGVSSDLASRLIEMTADEGRTLRGFAILALARIRPYSPAIAELLVARMAAGGPDVAAYVGAVAHLFSQGAVWDSAHNWEWERPPDFVVDALVDLAVGAETDQLRLAGLEALWQMPSFLSEEGELRLRQIPAEELDEHMQSRLTGLLEWLDSRLPR